MDSPFTITVFDKAFTRRGTVGDPDALVVNLRHNQQGTAALTIRSDHHRLPDLAAHGARVVIDYDGTQVLSGVVRLRQGSGPSDRGSVTLQVSDDFRLLTRVLGWQVPGAAIGSQGTAEFRNYSDFAESVVKDVVTDNAITRLGLPVTVATDQGRGDLISVDFRMHPLADRLMPAVDQAGFGVTVSQSGAGLVVDGYEPATYPRALSEASGIVTEWSWSEADPEASRVVVGGAGEGTARAYRLVVDAAREADYGDVIEVHRDARNTATTADLDAAGAEALAEAAPTAGLSLRLAETSTFRYDPTGSSGIRVGDVVTVEVGAGVTVTDVLRECALSWTSDGGLDVTPVVGPRSDDPNRALVTAVGRLARGFRNLTAGR